MEKGQALIKNLVIEFIRNILDIFVASYYLNKPVGKAKSIGVIGVITSLIGIGQALGKLWNDSLFIILRFISSYSDKKIHFSIIQCLWYK